MNEATTGDHRRVIALFTLSGAALGVLLSMLFFTRPDNAGYGQTDIELSTMLTVATTIVGFFVGVELSELSRRIGLFVTMGVLFLTGLLGAAMGWLVGSFLANDNLMNDYMSPSPGRAMAVGAIAGLFIGSMTLAPRWLRETIERINAILGRTSTKLILVACVAIACVVGIEVWGYYRGLNVLPILAATCLLGCMAFQNRFLLVLAVGTCIAYMLLSIVTIAR